MLAEALPVLTDKKGSKHTRDQCENQRPSACAFEKIFHSLAKIESAFYKPDDRSDRDDG